MRQQGSRNISGAATPGPVRASSRWGGPTTFPLNPRITDLSVSGGDLQLTPVDADRAAGTLRLTVENHGPQRATAPELIVRPPQKFEVTSLPSGCTRFVSSGGTSYTCQLPVLGVNGTVDLDLPVSVQRSQVGTGRVGEYSAQVSWTDDGVSYPEPAGAWKNSLVDGNLVVND